jgi:transketolase
VMSHDSIGLGEDGPTHQPVEHLSSLRAMPNLLVFRPADLIETVECWQLALISKTTPSILALSRQELPQLRARGEVNLSQKGAYILKEAHQPLQVTIFATGSELHLAYEAAIALEAKGIGVRVISMVCFSLFEQQSKSYQDALLGNSSLKVAVEAAVRHGWDRYITRDGIFIGMSSFGTCGKYQELYQHFGISVPQIIKTIMEKL